MQLKDFSVVTCFVNIRLFSKIRKKPRVDQFLTHYCTKCGNQSKIFDYFMNCFSLGCEQSIMNKYKVHCTCEGR